MFVRGIHCYTSKGIPLFNFDVISYASSTIRKAYTQDKDWAYQEVLNELYEAESKEDIDRILDHARFQRKEPGTLVYSVSVGLNLDIVKISIKED